MRTNRSVATEKLKAEVRSLMTGGWTFVFFFFIFYLFIFFFIFLHLYMTTGKTIALTRRIFVGKNKKTFVLF